MTQPFPTNLRQWLREIHSALQAAREPFVPIRPGNPSTSEADLFRLAPYICLSYRGLDLSESAEEQAVRGAFTTYAFTTGSRGTFKVLRSQPERAFALCYLAAHRTLDLMTDEAARKVMGYCEGHLDRSQGQATG